MGGTLDVCKAIPHCSAFTATLAGGRASGLTPFLYVTGVTLQMSGGAGMEAIPPVLRWSSSLSNYMAASKINTHGVGVPTSIVSVFLRR